MLRSVVAAVTGVAVGAVAVACIVRGFDLEPGPLGAPGLRTLAESGGALTVSRESGGASPQLFAIQTAALERAAAIEDSFTLEDEIARVAAEPASFARDAKLAALLDRLLDADPYSAVELAQRLDLDERHIAALFRAWADTDPDTALGELRNVRSLSQQRAAALAMLEVFGMDAAGIERIAAIYEPIEARAFTVDAIAKRAEYDLIAAMDAAEAFVGWTSVALTRVADVAARLNPGLAVQESSRIDANLLRTRFRSRLLDEWAKVDPEGMLTYLESADLSEMSVTQWSFEAAAAAAPERLLALIERFGPRQRTEAQRAVSSALASLDPAAAYERIRALPPTGDINALILNIAQRIARQSPREALVWATSLEPRSTVALNAVLANVATNDPMLAVDTVIGEILDPVAARRGEMPSLMPVVTVALNNDRSVIAGIADRLAAHSDSRVRAQLENVVSQWASVDPASAADWVLRNPSLARPSIALDLARQLAANNPALVTQSMARMPAEQRGPWIVGAAQGLASSDFDGALAWVEQYRNESAYGAALSAAVEAGARGSPQAVARLIDADPAGKGALAPTVVSAWARQDPVGAAAWLRGATGLDEPVRTNAVVILVPQFASADPTSARTWVFDLPPGTVRDAGLSGLMTYGAPRGEIDTALLNAYHSPEARDRALVGAMRSLGSSNPALGRSLIEQHIRDPELRRQAEQRLEAGASSPASPFGIGGPGILIR